MMISWGYFVNGIYDQFAMISVVSIPRFADEFVICPMGNSRRLRIFFGGFGAGKVGKSLILHPSAEKNPQNPPGFPRHPMTHRHKFA